MNLIRSFALFITLSIVLLGAQASPPEKLQYANCEIDVTGLDKLGEGYYRDPKPISESMKKVEIVRRISWNENYPRSASVLNVNGDLVIEFIPGKYFVFVALNSLSENSVALFSDYSSPELLKSINCLSIYGIEAQTLELQFELATTEQGN